SSMSSPSCRRHRVVLPWPRSYSVRPSRANRSRSEERWIGLGAPTRWPTRGLEHRVAALVVEQRRRRRVDGERADLADEESVIAAVVAVLDSGGEGDGGLGEDRPAVELGERGREARDGRPGAGPAGRPPAL